VPGEKERKEEETKGNYGTRELGTAENAKSEQHNGVTSYLFELYRTRTKQINHAGKYLPTANERS
jgi:hypothetical protein